MNKKWPILEWDLFHPLCEELPRAGCPNPSHISFGPRTADTWITTQELGQRLQNYITGASMLNPSRGPAKFIWLAIEAEIDPEDRNISSKQCGRVAHDPLLMQVITEAVQTPVREACRKIAEKIRFFEQSTKDKSLKPGQNPKQTPEVCDLVIFMKTELGLALDQARTNIIASQSSVPASATGKGESLRKGRIILNLGLGVLGVGLAIAGIVLSGGAGAPAVVLAAYGLYRGFMDTTKAFFANLESAARIRTRLESALARYRRNAETHGKEAIIKMLLNPTLKTGVLYNLTGSAMFASLADIDDDIEQYEGIIQKMRAQLGQMSEQVCDQMDAIQALESKHSLVTKTVSFTQMLPRGETRTIALSRSRQELALEALLTRIEETYPRWESDLSHLGPLKKLGKEVLAGNHGSAVAAEKWLDIAISAGVSLASAHVDPPKKWHEILGVIVDGAGQLDPAGGAIVGAVKGRGAPDRFQGGSGGI